MHICHNKPIVLNSSEIKEVSHVMWKNRNVWIVLLSEFVVGLGLWAGIIGNLTFMQNLVPSDFHKSIILAIGMLAGLAVGPLAGRVIDQYPKKSVLVWSQVGRVLSVLLMFLAIHFNSIMFMVLFLIVLQLAAAFFLPAIQAVVPMIATNEDLLELNAWHMNVRTISRIIGTAAAGLMVTYFDVIWLYVVSMVMYALMLIVILGFKLPEAKVQVKVKNKAKFTEMFPILKGYPMVLTALVLMVIPTLFLGSFNLMVINIVEMHQNSSLSGLIYTFEGIGFMLGAFVVKRLAEKIKPITLLFGAVFIMGILDMSLILSNHQYIAVATFMCFGFFVGCFFPTTMTIFQKDLPKEYHGRFFSFRNMLDSVLFQVILLSAGAMLDLIGLQMMGIVFGVISLVLATFFLWFITGNKKSAINKSYKNHIT